MLLNVIRLVPVVVPWKVKTSAPGAPSAVMLLAMYVRLTNVMLELL
jgi:hypothetical protein